MEVLRRIKEHRRSLLLAEVDMSLAAIHLTRKEATSLFYEVCDPFTSDVMHPFKRSGEAVTAMATGREAEFIHQQMNRCFDLPVFVDLREQT